MSKIVKVIGEIDAKLSKQEIIALGKENALEISANVQYDMFKVYIELKRYELYLKTLVDEIKIVIIEKAKEDGKKDFEYGSTKIQFTTRRKFDYSVDEEWSKITDEMNIIKEDKSAREKLLKSIDGDFKEILDEETGEVIKVYAPAVELIEGVVLRL